MISTLRDMPPGLFVLEFGGGPTLYAVAALASRAREIHFCDYVSANLDEVRCWLDNKAGAFDWTTYIKMALEEEGQPTTSGAVAHREAEMRRKVTRLLACDALATAPLGQGSNKYDLVVAQTSTDATAATVAEWMQIICNISTLVVAGGRLLISVITGTSEYTVGQKSFPCLHLTDEDIRRGYIAAGYDPNTLQLERLIVTGGRDYSGITTAVACKLHGGLVE